MPNYFYTAKSPEGETKSGVFSAKNIHQLAQILRSQGLILIKAVSEEEKKKRKFRIFLPFLGRVSLTEKMMMIRNLQVMIAAGLPLARNLAILANQARRKKFKKALLDIEEEIKKGKSFAQALTKYPNIFSELFQNMIKVGEEAGTLEEVLKILTLQMEKEHELKSKVKGAMIYPAVIITAMIGIGILMLVIVIPKLSTLFQELGIELPLTTKIVIWFGISLAQYWYFFVAALFSLFFLFWLFLKTEKGKRLRDNFLLKIPVISSIIKKSNSASTIRTLSSLISSGVSIVRSLEIISGTLRNVYFKRAMAEAAEKVKKGEKLSEVLKLYQNIYPLGVVQMIEVGEETGETSKILPKLADFYEEEVSNATKNLTSLIEPILMLIIGAAVAFFAVSMLQPMYSMLGGL